MKNKYAHFFAAYNASVKRGNYLTKEEVVESFTNGRTKSLKDLTFWELQELTRSLTNGSEAQCNQMRRKILSMCHSIGWEDENGKVDFKRLNDWCVHKSFGKKELSKFTFGELPKLVSQFTIVYKYILQKAAQ